MNPNERYAAQLVKDVIDNLRAHGLIVTVSLQPDPSQPLAMGAYVQAIDVRPTPQARKQAEALAKASQQYLADNPEIKTGEISAETLERLTARAVQWLDTGVAQAAQQLLYQPAEILAAHHDKYPNCNCPLCCKHYGNGTKA